MCPFSPSLSLPTSGRRRQIRTGRRHYGWRQQGSRPGGGGKSKGRIGQKRTAVGIIKRRREDGFVRKLNQSSPLITPTSPPAPLHEVQNPAPPPPSPSP